MLSDLQVQNFEKMLQELSCLKKTTDNSYTKDLFIDSTLACFDKPMNRVCQNRQVPYLLSMETLQMVCHAITIKGKKTRLEHERKICDVHIRSPDIISQTPNS